MRYTQRFLIRRWRTEEGCILIRNRDGGGGSSGGGGS